MKDNRGITLIALIITIVVLLILAGVAIGTLEQTDIIGRAKEATRSYNQAKDDEDSTLTKAEEEMEDIIAKLNKEPAQSGIKVYLIDGEGVYILTPENQIKFFRNDSPIEEGTIYVTEGKGNWTIQHEGFSNEEINNLKYLYNDDVKTIFAVTSDRNLLVLPADINSDSKTVKFSNSSDTAVRHNEEYVSQYYNEEENVEYYYGEYDDFSPSPGITYLANQNIYKVDLNKNVITIYNKRDGLWEKDGDYDIVNKDANSTPISVIVEGKTETLSTSALRFEFLYYGINIICYIQDNTFYNYLSRNFADGVELTKGFDILTGIKYINTSLLPQ